MQKAIKVLQDKINECENMTNWFTQELLKHQHATADQMEVQRLKIGKQEAIDVSKGCFDAIGMLTKQDGDCVGCSGRNL